MEWIQTLTIIGAFAAFFIYMMNRMDTKLDQLRSEFRNELHEQISSVRNEVDKKISELRTEMREGFNNLRQHILIEKLDRIDHKLPNIPKEEGKK